MNWSALKCVALDFRGRRCGRRCITSIPVTFTWDPVTGRGFGGPAATFCRTHDGEGPPEESDARVAVIGGWLGRAWNPRYWIKRKKTCKEPLTEVKRSTGR